MPGSNRRSSAKSTRCFLLNQSKRSSSMHRESLPLRRAEIMRETVDPAKIGVVHRPLSLWERIFDQSAVRKLLLLALLALAWQAYASWLNNPLLVPTFSMTVDALWQGVVSGGLLTKAWYSLRV